MQISHTLIIILCSSFTGWLISYLLIRFLFWPVDQVSIGGLKIQGLIPAKKQYLSSKAGEFIQSEFQSYAGLEQAVSDPLLLEKLKPEIESHVDHFLKEKLKSVFPLLSQFMGEKTINQFKSAFLAEIDSLFPILMTKYVSNLKQEVNIGQLISERMNALSTQKLKELFHQNMHSQLLYFKLICTGIGLLMGIITILILFITNF